MLRETPKLLQPFPPTIVLRHRRENLSKCSLKGCEPREDFIFLKYPVDALPSLEGYVLLAIEGPPLTSADADKGLFVLDGTWRLAVKMRSFVERVGAPPLRSLPGSLRTAYPRRQADCEDPLRGLASIEAIYAAYHLMGRATDGLFDHYKWGREFLSLNSL